MSYDTVRTAMQAWLAPPNVPGLNVVYAAQPPIAGGAQYGIDTFNLGNGQGSGAFAFLHIFDTSETRIAIGGATSGIKHVEYQVGVVFPFIAVNPTGDDSYIAAWDQVADGLKARIRAGRTLGQTGLTIWQAGEGVNDLRIQSDLPVKDGSAVHIWSVLEVTVIEELVNT